MKNIYEKLSDKNNIVVETVSKDFVYAAVPDLFRAISMNDAIIKNCNVNVAITFEKAIFDVTKQEISAEKAVLAFTISPLIK